MRKLLAIVSLLVVTISFSTGCVTCNQDYTSSIYDALYLEEELIDMRMARNNSCLDVEVVKSIEESLNFQKIIMGETFVDLNVRVTKESFDLSFHLEK